MLLITCSFWCYRPPLCIERGRVTISWQKRQILMFWGSKSLWFLENTAWRFLSLLRPKGRFSWHFQYKKISPKKPLFFAPTVRYLAPTSFKFPANLWSRSGKQGRTSNFFVWQSEPWCSQRIRKQNRSNISYRKCAFYFTKKPLEATVTNFLVTELGFLACRKSCRFVGLLIICHGVSWRFELKYVWLGKNRSGHT